MQERKRRREQTLICAGEREGETEREGEKTLTHIGMCRRER